MSSQPEVSRLAPELVESVTGLARTLTAAVRNWTLYPADHPAVRESVERLTEALQEATRAGVLSLGVTPDSLIVEQQPVPPHPHVAEAARLLHDRDLLRLTLAAAIPQEAVTRLLPFLALDRDRLRSSGGPEAVWRESGHPSVAVEQIDFAYVLEDRDVPPGRQRDDVWTALVSSIAAGRACLDERSQERLLEIAADPVEIRDLAIAVSDGKRTADGAPMITMQAAAVRAAFSHLAGIVAVRTPDHRGTTFRNLATALAGLEPHVAMEILRLDDDSADAVQVMHGVRACLDDMRMAELLAAALEVDGQATGRMAEVFDTLAPDPERKRRVLGMTKTLLAASPMGRRRQFQTIWGSMEELLVTYNDKPFVSQRYRNQLDGAAGRAQVLGSKDIDEDMPGWAESLGRQNIRRLSVLLLIDLLGLERDAARAGEIAYDLTALAEDLLMSGDYEDARDVTGALQAAATRDGFVGRDAARAALAHVAASPAMHETVSALGELDPEPLSMFAGFCRMLGAPSVEALATTLRIDGPAPARLRAADIIAGFGAPAVSRLAAYVDDERVYVQCHAAALLGRIGAPAAVPLLQPLLRRGEPALARAAVAALAIIEDPAAARAIHTVLRAATGDLRRAVVEALVAERNVRVVPMLARILEESDPLGADHDVVLHVLGALTMVHTDAVIGAIVKVAARRRWFARSRVRALIAAAVDTLACMGTPASHQALATAAATGHRRLRRLASARLHARADAS